MTQLFTTLYVEQLHLVSQLSTTFSFSFIHHDVHDDPRIFSAPGRLSIECSQFFLLSLTTPQSRESQPTAVFRYSENDFLGLRLCSVIPAHCVLYVTYQCIRFIYQEPLFHSIQWNIFHLFMNYDIFSFIHEGRQFVESFTMKSRQKLTRVKFGKMNCSVK